MRATDEHLWAEHAEEGDMPEPTSHTLDVPGAVLAYDIRGDSRTNEPPLLLIAAPMGAAGFATLAGHFSDRMVVTYDPRGVERSERTDRATESTPDEHADDLHRLIAALGTGPVDMFASSGGAVNALVLVTRHPEQVRTLVAHEPPSAQVLPDADAALAANVDVHETYMRSGLGPGMAKFIALSSHKGPIPADYAAQPSPDPAMFGLPTDDDGSRNDPLLGQNIVSLTQYRFDFDALRAASTRIVIAAGAESEGELAHRAARAVAELLGTEAVIFPSHHGGFLGGEYGQTGDPDAFAVKLREVLAAAA
jgi:pimeloyl-ACP methyl ester carboxylesterase